MPRAAPPSHDAASFEEEPEPEPEMEREGVKPLPQRPPLAADKPPAMDPALDVVAEGPPVEDESFTLSKKRLELIIEEKEWELSGTGPRKSEAKMVRIMEYVDAVEAYQELCAARVPHTAGPHCSLILYRCT